MDKKQNIVQRANEVFNTEIDGIKAVQAKLDDSFVELVERCSDAIDRGGKLVITGVGKSGYIGKKIAATLSSVGNPSVFMHPVEARHGDLGLLQKEDLLIAISYSGAVIDINICTFGCLDLN